MQENESHFGVKLHCENQISVGPCIATNILITFLFLLIIKRFNENLLKIENIFAKIKMLLRLTYFNKYNSAEMMMLDFYNNSCILNIFKTFKIGSYFKF